MTKDRNDRRSTRAEPNRADFTQSEPTRTMGSVSHTNPVTGESFGESQVFTRGRTIVADGGEADAAEDAEDDEDDVARVRDVDHTPREGAPDASAVYERGGEGAMSEAAEENGDEGETDGDEAEEPVPEPETVAEVAEE